MLFTLVVLAVLALDQATKALVREQLELGQSIPVINEIFHITLVKNPGGAFGLIPGGKTLFMSASILVIVSAIGYKVIRKPNGRLINVALALVVGGAAGNLFDRLSTGRVVDWIDFRIWPVFNFADTSVVLGLGLLSLLIITQKTDNE